MVPDLARALGHARTCPVVPIGRPCAGDKPVRWGTVLDDAERLSPPDAAPWQARPPDAGSSQARPPVADPWRLRVPGVRLQRRLAAAQRHGDWRCGVDTFLGVAEPDGREVTVRVYRRAVRDERRRQRFADEVELLRRLST